MLSQGGATMDYEAHALEVMRRIGLKVAISRGDHKCPKWCDGNHTHGDRYLVTLLSPRGARSLRFDFWGSLHDKANGKTPTAYDVLACVSSDASLPTDPDEVVEELGPMKPSQAIAAAKWAKDLQGFFTQAELDALSEIQ